MVGHLFNQAFKDPMVMAAIGKAAKQNPALHQALNRYAYHPETGQLSVHRDADSAQVIHHLMNVAAKDKDVMLGLGKAAHDNPKLHAALNQYRVRPA